MKHPEQRTETYRITAVPDTGKILDLVKKCGDGDDQALNEFFEQFAEDIYNFPLKVFHLDEDAASDFFLYAYERLRDGGRFRSFQGRSSFRTWFYTVLRNLVIDWMRTIREVQTVQLKQTDDKGNEYRVIENSPDPRSLGEPDLTVVQKFTDRLSQLGMELRLVFKLSYIYYMDLDDEEIRGLSERSGRTPGELIRFLSDLKNILSEKEIKNLGSEDKITSLYLNILDLKTKKEKLKSTPGGMEHLEASRIERSIQKKYQQREKLLERKEKGHFVVRTPYKFISELLKIPEGSVSVQMMRALEKIRE